MPTSLFLVTALAELLLAAVVLLVLGSAAARGVRGRRQVLRLREVALARPVLLGALDGAADGARPELSRAVGRRLDSMVAPMVTQLRGADREALIALLRDRGTIDAARLGTRSRRPMKRLSSVELLGAVGVPDAVPDLIRCLHDRNPDVRRAAVRAVGRSGSPDGVAPLLELADRPGRSVSRHGVTLALLRLGPDAAPALTAALAEKDGGHRGRTAAANVLGWLGHLGAVDGLCAVLDEPAPGIGEAGEPKGGAGKLKGGAGKQRGGAGELRGGAQELRIAVLDALGRIGSPAAAGALGAGLDPAHPVEVRAAAARALGRLGDPSASDALGGMLTGEHELARAAAGALGQLGAAGRGRLEAAAGHAPEAGEELARSAVGAGVGAATGVAAGAGGLA